MFLGAAVSYDRGLDGKWRVFGDFESSGCGGQHGDSADLAKFEGGLYVGGVENILDGNAFGLMLSDELAQANRDTRQARGHRVTRGKFDGSADDADESIVVAAIGEQIDDAVPGVFRTAM